MATYFRIFDVAKQFLDSNGDPLAGGKIYVYEAGTSTVRATFKDNAGATSHANPIVLDSEGRIEDGTNVWVATGDSKVNLLTSADAQVTGWPEDNVTGIGDAAAGAASEWVDYAPTATRNGNTTFLVAGDQTAEFHVGRRLKITDASALYATIITTSYNTPSAGNTTVTVVVDDGTNLSSSMDGAGTVAYGINSADNPSTPQQIKSASASVMLTSTQTQVAAADTYEQIDLDDESGTGLWDIGGNFDIVTGHDYVAPSAGTYLVFGRATMAVADGEYVQGAVYVGGTERLTGSRSMAGGSDTAVSNVTGLLVLAASDSVELWGRTSKASGGSYGNGLTGCLLQITQLSAL